VVERRTKIICNTNVFSPSPKNPAVGGEKSSPLVGEGGRLFPPSQARGGGGVTHLLPSMSAEET